MRNQLMIIFLMISSVLLAQVDTTYIKALSSKIAIKIDGNTERLKNDFDIPNSLKELKTIRLKPNEDYKIRFTASYRFLTLSYSFIPKFIGGNDDNDEKGKTNSFNLGLNLTFPKWTQSITYKKTEGFYIDNTADFVSEEDLGARYIKLPDTKLKQFVSETYFFGNGKKHSLKLMNNEQEQQIKSSGSLVVPLLFNYQNIKMNSDNPDFRLISDIYPEDFNFYIATTGIGYSYYYVPIKNWYVSSLAVPLIAHEWKNRDLSNGTKESQNNFSGGIKTQLAIGHNSEKLFGGVKGSFTYTENFTGDYDSRYNEKMIQIFVGYRFKAPRIIKKNFDKIENVLKKESL